MASLSSLTQPRCPDRLFAQLRQLLVHSITGERLYNHVAPAEQLTDPVSCKITLLALAKHTDKHDELLALLNNANSTLAIQAAARDFLSKHDPDRIVTFDRYAGMHAAKEGV